MNKATAYLLIQSYIDGWINGNLESIVSTLCEDCVIIESHGPRYTGLENIKGWVNDWFVDNNRVNRWKVSSFCFTDENAFFEWSFNCSFENKIYDFEGASLVTFRDSKIFSINEYRRTEPVFDWSK